jgi:hypothetical protein
MISILYGSPAAGSPNNWPGIIGRLGNDAPNICELALPTTTLPFSRSMGSPGQTILRHARPQLVMQ